MDKTIKTLYIRLLGKNTLSELEQRSLDTMFTYRTTMESTLGGFFINDGYGISNTAFQKSLYQNEKKIYEFIVRHKTRWTIR
jgi:hypothetical protein